jgi:iron complex transport system substrate-binding protein
MLKAQPRRQSSFATPVVVLLVTVAALLALAGCGASSTAVGATPTVPAAPVIATDGVGRPIVIPASAPQKIVSLEPSNSEILAALGVAPRVIGVDNYTDYPADMAAKTPVTDNYGQPNLEQIVALQPDLVLDYQGFHADADKQLAQAGIDVVVVPTPAGLEQLLTEIRLVGQLVHAYDTADALANRLQGRIDAVRQKVAGAAHSTVYMESDYSTPGKPYAFGGGGFGDEMIRYAGGANVFGASGGGDGTLATSDEAVIAANPEVIVLTEDPKYGGEPQTVYGRQGWSAIAAVQGHKVYANHTPNNAPPRPPHLDGLEQLAKDIHPGLFS